MKKLCIVEDSENDFFLMQRFLQRFFPHILCERFAYGEQAFHELEAREEWPDMIWIDLGLPRMGGAELVQSLKKIRPSIPIYILSGCPDDPYVLTGAASGADGIIDKNLDKQRLAELFECF